MIAGAVGLAALQAAERLYELEKPLRGPRGWSACLQWASGVFALTAAERVALDATPEPS